MQELSLLTDKMPMIEYSASYADLQESNGFVFVYICTFLNAI